MPNHQDLISRLEAAKEPSRELFEAAYIACFGAVESIAYSYKRTVHYYRFLQLIQVGAWTDAALMLVPKEYDWSREEEGGYMCIIDRQYGGWVVVASAFGATPALALVIAALKAMQALEKSNGRS